VESEFGEAKVRFGEIEIRLQEDFPEPFPLYPYELIEQKAQAFKTVPQNTALLLKAIRPFKDERSGLERFSED